MCQVYQATWEVEGWQLDTAPGVGDGFISREGTLPGMSIVTFAGCTRVGTMERIDTTPLVRKRRLVRWVKGRRVNTRWWFDDSEPKQKPQKSDTFPLINLGYFQKRADRGNYQVSLRPWT